MVALHQAVNAPYTPVKLYSHIKRKSPVRTHHDRESVLSRNNKKTRNSVIRFMSDNVSCYAIGVIGRTPVI